MLKATICVVAFVARTARRIADTSRVLAPCRLASSHFYQV